MGMSGSASFQRERKFFRAARALTRAAAASAHCPVRDGKEFAKTNTSTFKKEAGLCRTPGLLTKPEPVESQELRYFSGSRRYCGATG